MAYLAGIVEGEGTIGIEKGKIDKYRKNHKYILRLQVVNTDKRLLNWLKENYGGTVDIKSEAKENWRRVYQWRLGSKRAYTLLKCMRPYLVFKKEQADLAIEFYQMTLRRIQSEVPMWLNVKREAYYQKLKALHH